MPAERIDDLDDPRLAPYRNLKDRELGRMGGRFIAESEFVVRRLLASVIPVESVVVAERKAAAIAAAVPPGVPVYAVPDRLLNEVVGFKFHTGVMAVGVRPTPPAVADVVPAAGRPSTIVVLPDLNNFENLGAIVRTAVGFGVDAVVLGERSCDPFFRMSVRVSVGAIFNVPIVRPPLLADALAELKGHGYECVGTVLDDAAEPLQTATRGDRLAILFGNEAVGLSAAERAACDRLVTLPMRRGTDSLNVAAAAAVFLYHFTCRPA